MDYTVQPDLVRITRRVTVQGAPPVVTGSYTLAPKEVAYGLIDGEVRTVILEGRIIKGKESQTEGAGMVLAYTVTDQPQWCAELMQEVCGG